VTGLTRADLQHVYTALESYQYWLRQYPETVKDADEDELAIAIQVVKEKLDE